MKRCQYPGCFEPRKKKTVRPGLGQRPPRYCEKHLYVGRYVAHRARKLPCDCGRDYLTVPLEHADYCVKPLYRPRVS